MAGMELIDALLVAGAGVIAGIVNAMAGGGSLLTVALLNVFVGLPGLVANGTNRVGVLVQNASSVAGYRKEGISGLKRALPVLVPVIAGSLIGSLLVSSVTDAAFERIFGVLMIPLVFLSLRTPSLNRQTHQLASSSHRRCVFWDWVIRRCVPSWGWTPHSDRVIEIRP